MLATKWKAMAADAEGRGMELVEVEEEDDYLGMFQGRVATRAAKDTITIINETSRLGEVMGAGGRGGGGE